MKPCIKCGVTKSLTEFYAHPKMADGRLGKCKSCTKIDANTRRDAKKLDPEWIEAERARCRAKAARARKVGTFQNSSNAVKSAWRKRNPVQTSAHKKVSRALSKGIITKPSACNRCGAKTRLEAHHADYSKPLAVEWLCPVCHGKTKHKDS